MSFTFPGGGVCGAHPHWVLDRGPMRGLGLHFVRAACVATLGVAPAIASAAPRELGFNVHQSSTVGIDATKAAGLGWVRIDLNWYDAEPTQGAYDWARFDALMAAAAAKNLKVLAVLGYTPAWASAGDTKGGGTLNDVPRAGTFAPFVTAAVNRYKASVTHFEIWNEPNLEQFFEGSPQDYIDRVLVPGADAVHAACATCKVMGPGLASVGNQYATWMDAVLGAAASKLDVVSAHIYAGFPDGSGTGAGLTSDSFFNKLEDHRVVKVGGATVYEGPLSFREVMQKRGVTKPFWLTETGREATAGNAQEEEAQRVYTRKVLESMLSRPWWEATIFYEAFDLPPAPYRWGAVVADPAAPGGFREKTVMSLLRKVSSSQPLFGGTKHDCDDGLDNDGDGLLDGQDPECRAGVTLETGGVADAGAGEGGGASSGGASSGGSSGASSSSSGGPGGASSSSGTSGGGSDASGDGGGCRASSGSGGAGLLGVCVAIFALARARARRRERS